MASEGFFFAILPNHHHRWEFFYNGPSVCMLYVELGKKSTFYIICFLFLIRFLWRFFFQIQQVNLFIIHFFPFDGNENLWPFGMCHRIWIKWQSAFKSLYLFYMMVGMKKKLFIYVPKGASDISRGNNELKMAITFICHFS